MSGPNTDLELNELLARLVAIGRRLRMSKEPRSTRLSPAVSTWDMEQVKNDQEEKIKQPALAKSKSVTTMTRAQKMYRRMSLVCKYGQGTELEE